MNLRPYRVVFHLTPSREELPFDYHYALRQRVNSWLGIELGGAEGSMYSYSWLHGKYVTSPTGIAFPEGASFAFSGVDAPALQTILTTVGYDSTLLNGMDIVDVYDEPVRDFTTEERFFLSSPALVRSKEGNLTRHLLYNDPRTAELLTATMQQKLAAANMDGRAELSFDTSYRRAKYKTVQIGHVKHLCSYCPVTVRASSPQVVKFVWAVGIGDLTGSGFGAIL